MMRGGIAFRIKTTLMPVLLLLSACLSISACAPQGTDPEGGGKSGQACGTEVTEIQAVEWYYDQLDEARRNAYDAFRRAAQDPFSGQMTEILSQEGGPAQIAATQLDSVYQGFLYDHPELFWLDRSYQFRVCGTGEEKTADAVAVIPLYETPEELAKYSDRFMGAAEELLDGLKTPAGGGTDPGMIYDSLAGHAHYREEALYDPSCINEHSAYGAIVEKSAVCDGYALALKYLMNRCGYECIVIPGTVNGADHVWNTAFWDGVWHEMDITWDASSGGGRQYFDLTTEEMERDHLRDPEGAVPAVPVSADREDGLFGNRLRYEQERNQS